MIDAQHGCALGCTVEDLVALTFFLAGTVLFAARGLGTLDELVGLLTAIRRAGLGIFSLLTFAIAALCGWLAVLGAVVRVFSLLTFAIAALCRWLAVLGAVVCVFSLLTFAIAAGWFVRFLAQAGVIAATVIVLHAVVVTLAHSALDVLATFAVAARGFGVFHSGAAFALGTVVECRNQFLDLI